MQNARWQMPSGGDGSAIAFVMRGGMEYKSDLEARIMMLDKRFISLILPISCLLSNGFWTASCTDTWFDVDKVAPEFAETSFTEVIIQQNAV